MIVNKPQFDTDSIKPGQAYWLTENNGYRHNVDAPCIIISAKPLTVVVEYYSEKQKDMKSLTLDINSIVNKSFSLKKMVIESKEEDGVKFD